MKSPLKSKPLRNPGDSVQAALYELVFDKIFLHFLTAVILAILAAVEWVKWKTQAPPNPVFYSIVAGLYALFAAAKLRRAIKEAKALKLGRDGERAVGQYLEHLRETGAKVFHDIPGDGFNLDHVVIHSSGIYVIETKTYSKPEEGSPKILFDGSSVSIMGRKPDRNPITQVQAAATWLTHLLKESCGKTCQIRPVVTFPGWFVQPTAEAKHSNVWVLNPKALPSFIEHSHVTLSKEDVNLFSYHLSRYVRAS